MTDQFRQVRVNPRHATVSGRSAPRVLRWPERGACLLAALALLTALSLSSAHAAPSAAEQNWPQWRGPLSTGASPTANPPLDWSETKNVKWKVAIPGDGTSTPVIWGNQVFVLTAIPTGKKLESAESPAAPAGGGDGGRARGGRGMGGPRPSEVHQFAIVCLDRQTGRELWRQVACEAVPHEGHHPDGSFAPHSPITDGQHVFAYYGSRGLYCYDLQGNKKWEKNFGQMQIRMAFGEGSSPALFGDKVVVNWDHEGDDFTVALNKETGAEVWRQAREEDTSWATPLIVEHNGQAQVITAATGKIRSYDLATGKLIWEATGMTANVIPSPVASEDAVYCISGFRGNALLAIRLGRTGDLTGTDAIAWSHKKNTPYVPSPLLSGDRLYFYSNNNSILSCFNVKSGQPLIDAERIEGMQGVYASPVAANGRVYLVDRNGTTVVLKQADTLEVLATSRLEDKFDASPALAGQELFLRGRGHLYCLAEL